MNKHPDYFEEELHGFIDGELEQTRAETIARLIESDPEVAARVAAYRADKEQLRALYSELESRPLPKEWLDRIENRATPASASAKVLPFTARRALPLKPLMALAACLMVVIGAWTAYQRLTISGEEAIIAEATSARGDAMRPVQSYAAAELPQSERRNQIVAAALEMPLKVPDLQKFGYRLADVRVYSGVPGGKSVELEYRGMDNRLFTLYMRHPNAPARVDMMQKAGLWTCIWQDDVLGTVMQGEMTAGEMARLASLAYNELYL